MDSCQSFCINLSVPPFIYISIKILISIYISLDSRISTWSLKIFEFKVGISGEDWTELDTNWQKVATQVSCLSIDLFIYFYINLSMNHLSIYLYIFHYPPPTQVRHWQWLLDTGLPGEFGQIGEWLNQGEGLIYGDDIPTQVKGFTHLPVCLSIYLSI